MLQEICEYIHNYFISSTQRGEFAIAGGAFSPPLSLKEGQRFMIAGSDLNDGIYTWHESGVKNDDDDTGAGLTDEVFTGAVCGLAVPPQLVALSAEVSEWVENYGEVVDSPYQSESFGGYSYTKASGSASGSNGGAAGWQEVFASRMNRWRKVAFL